MMDREDMVEIGHKYYHQQVNDMFVAYFAALRARDGLGSGNFIRSLLRNRLAEMTGLDSETIQTECEGIVAEEDARKHK